MTRTYRTARNRSVVAGSGRARSEEPTTRFGVERLEPRQLLTADLWAGSDASRLLRETILRTGGLSEQDAGQIVAGRDVRAASTELSLSETGYWSKLSTRAALRISPTVQAVRFESLTLDNAALTRQLKSAPAERFDRTRDELPVLMLPTPTGGVARFAMERYDLLAPHVAAQFPQTQSVRIYGLDDHRAVGSATITSSGLMAFVTSPDGDWHVDPLDARSGGSAHASYFHAHQFTPRGRGDGHPGGCHCTSCLGIESSLQSAASGGPEANPDALINLGQTRRTLRFAFGVTGQYTRTFSTEITAFNNVLGRINTGNVIFGRDFNLQLTVVSDTRTVFIDPFTDGYTNGDSVAMANQNAPILDNTYGLNAYDIGHALGQIDSIDGVSLGLGTVGGASKARAASTANPLSADFNVVLFHEIGHQLGAPHTYNSANGPQRSAGTAYEPGPGSTIMSYGSAALGYAGSFVTFNDLYFHHNSIDRVEDFLATIPTVGTSVTTTNRVPVANAGPDHTIPANTYFELTGQAYDDQHNALTYTWEQYDLGPEVPIGTNANTATGPLLRSREGTANPTRTFGELDDILAGRVDVDESLPLVNRTVDPLTFRLTVRDQLGGVSDDVINLPVVATGAPFVITSQNAAGITWAAGSSQTVTWNVAGTTGNGINTPNVDIFLSYDAGVTFTPVALGVPNDGSQAITVPVDARASTTARVKVKGADNYFFDINNAPITITGIAPLDGLPVVAPPSELPIYASRTGEIRDAQLSLMNGANPSLDFTGDIDTYLFSPSITTEYLITTGRVGVSSVDTLLSVYDDLTGVPLAINDDFGSSTATSQVILFMEAGKRYRISIGEFQSNNLGDVFLNIVAGTNAPVASTIALDADGNGSTSNTLISSRESKFHQFTVPALFDGTGSISLTAPEASTVFSLYNAADDLIAFTQSGSFTSLSALVAGQTYTLRVGTQNYASGGGAYTINVDLGVIAAPSAPTVLLADDLGPSSTDGITRVNSNLGIVGIAPTGQFLRLFRDGVQVAGPTQVGIISALVLRDPATLANGNYTYTVTAAATATSPQSPVSSPLQVTIDTVAPTPNGFVFNFDANVDHVFFVDFTEPLFGFQSDDIVVNNTTSGQVIAASSFNLAVNSAGPGTNDYAFNPTAGNDFLPDGNYNLTIPEGAATDLAGNPTALRTESFFFLAGDTNRDRRVDFTDLLALARNYNQTGRTFSQGNFDYSPDGLVNFSDLVILARNYNVTLPSLFASTPITPITPITRTRPVHEILT